MTIRLSKDQAIVHLAHVTTSQVLRLTPGTARENQVTSSFGPHATRAGLSPKPASMYGRGLVISHKAGCAGCGKVFKIDDGRDVEIIF